MEKFSSPEEMQKYADALYMDGVEQGAEICLLHKAAQAGDPAAEAALAQAEAQAQGMMPPMEGGGAPPMSPTIPCPSCGQEVAPNPDGTCPVCGFNFNELAAAAPEPPSEEAISERAGEIKQASVNDLDKMNWLITNYAHVVQ